jgi:hypothetical protein
LVVKVQENSKGQQAVKTHEGTVLGAVPCQRHYRTFVQLSQERKQEKTIGGGLFAPPD